MKGVIAFDIDGTLTHRLDWIDPLVVKKLKEIADRGWQVALLTGRIYSFAKVILDQIDLPYVLAVQNGADIMDMPSKNSFQRNYLSSDILPQIEEAYEGAEEDFIIYAGMDQGDFCYYRPERYSKKRLEYLKRLESLGASPWRGSDFKFEKNVTFPLIKCFGKKEAMESLNHRLLKNPSIEVSMIRDPIDTSLYLNLITHSDANKGKGIQFLRQHFKAPIVVAAGDDFNDYKMLEAADISIVIETAPQKILELADVRARSPKDLGIIDAIEEAINLAS